MVKGSVTTAQKACTQTSRGIFPFLTGWEKWIIQAGEIPAFFMGENPL